MNELTILNQTVKTMSSREMADLCQKPHDNVLKLVRSLIEGGIVKSTTPHNYIHPQNGQTYVEYLSDKRDSLVIVARLSPEFTALVIDRWQELESQQSKELTRMDLIRLAYEAEQERLALEYKVSELQPKANALDIISVASTSLNIRETAKTVGIQEKKFIAWCINHDWLYRDSKGKLCPISHRIQNGFLEQRAVSYAKPNGEIGVSTQAMFTAKALTHLASIFAIIKEVA